jgi:hypothetical protein
MMRRRPPSAFRFPLALLLVAAPCLGETPDGGTNVSVSVAANGDTTVDVRRGELKVKSGGAESRVRTGETVRAQKGKPLKQLLGIVPATAPVDGATLNATEISFSWGKVTGATHYVVEISAAPELSGARSQTVDTTHAAVHLESGTWYWRVVALDGDGSPGKRAPPRRLTIDTTPPKLKTGRPEWR